MATILINGIDSLLGARVARQLSSRAEVQLLGLGTQPPRAPVGRAEVLTAALNGRQMVELLRGARVDVVAHLDIAGEEQPATSDETTIRQNVLGTMELLGACAAAGVRRVVVRSSTLVYGASYEHPAFISEDQPIARPGRPGLTRDYIEIDTFATDFARKRRDLQVVVLRCASLAGGDVSSPFMRYLARRNPITLFGFDPRIQVLHPDDAATAFTQAALHAVDGPLNLAANDPVKLVRAIRLTGRQPLPLFEPLTTATGVLGYERQLLAGWPFEWGFLRYSCVVDTRRARHDLGWTPEHSAEEILRGLGQATDAAPDEQADEAALQSFLTRRSET